MTIQCHNLCLRKMSPYGVRCAGWICSEQSDRGLKEPVGLAPGGLFDGDGGEGCSLLENPRMMMYIIVYICIYIYIYGLVFFFPWS